MSGGGLKITFHRLEVKELNDGEEHDKIILTTLTSFLHAFKGGSWFLSKISFFFERKCQNENSASKINELIT